MYRRILISLLAVFCLCSCSDRPRVIPEDTLSDIYMKMYINDQWLLKNNREHTKVDTTLFYDGIFAEYGYSFKDYDYTVQKYLKNPEKFKKVFEDTRSKLEKRRKELAAMKDIVDRNKAFDKQFEGLYEKQNFELKDINYLDFRLYVERRNSVRTYQESSTGDVTRFKPLAGGR